MTVAPSVPRIRARRPSENGAIFAPGELREATFRVAIARNPLGSTRAMRTRAAPRTRPDASGGSRDHRELLVDLPHSCFASAWWRQARDESFLVLPDGHTDLFFRRSRGRWRGFVVGPMLTAMRPPPTTDALIGVRLRIGTARTILGVTVAELAGRMIELDEFGLGGLVDAALLEDASDPTGGLGQATSPDTQGGDRPPRRRAHERTHRHRARARDECATDAVRLR